MIPSTKATATIFVKTTCINLCAAQRSEEHTSELQSRLHLVCRLLLEKKNKHENTAQRRRTPRNLTRRSRRPRKSRDREAPDCRRTAVRPQATTSSVFEGASL